VVNLPIAVLSRALRGHD